MAMGMAMGMIMAVIVWNHSEMLYYNITSAKAFVDGYGDGGGHERQRGRDRGSKPHEFGRHERFFQKGSRWKANSAQAIT